MASISCADCGDSRHRVPSNTLYCKKCRLLRDLDYWRSRTRRCGGCGKTFAPLGREDKSCSSCDPGLRAYAGTCLMGSRDAATRHEGRYPMLELPVCTGCARDPAKRAKLIDMLERGQTNRIAANQKEHAHA